MGSSGGATLPRVNANANRSPFFGRAASPQHIVFSEIYKNSAREKKLKYTFWEETYSFPKPRFF
jgi:hypothetical protein